MLPDLKSGKEKNIRAGPPPSTKPAIGIQCISILSLSYADLSVILPLSLRSGNGMITGIISYELVTNYE